MDNLDFWRLCDEFSVVQASLLIVGIDPSGEVGATCDTWETPEQPPGFHAAKSALTHAIRSGRLPASVRYRATERGWVDAVFDSTVPPALLDSTITWSVGPDEKRAEDKSCVYKPFPDWNLTTVTLENLRAWLTGREVSSGFFFQSGTAEPDYLNPKHPRYAAKLAATVKAWMSVDDPRGKTPKQALARWLREHAVEFDLVDDEGKPVELGIEECAKVANWQPGGGAPKTPAE